MMLPSLLTMKPLRKWSVDDVCGWVASIPLPAGVAARVVEVLRENAINGPVLESLSDEDLVAIGIQKFGWRRQLLLSRKELCDRLGPKFFNICSSTPSLVPSDCVQSPETSACPVHTTADTERGGAVVVDPTPRVLMQPPLSHRSNSPNMGPFGIQREFLKFANPRVACTTSPPRQPGALQIQQGHSMIPPRILGTPTHSLGAMIHAQATPGRVPSPAPAQVLARARATSQPRRSASPGPAVRGASPGPALHHARSPSIQRAQSPTRLPICLFAK